MSGVELQREPMSLLSCCAAHMADVQDKEEIISYVTERIRTPLLAAGFTIISFSSYTQIGGIGGALLVLGCEPPPGVKKHLENDTVLEAYLDKAGTEPLVEWVTDRLEGVLSPEEIEDAIDFGTAEGQLAAHVFIDWDSTVLAALEQWSGYGLPIGEELCYQLPANF